MSEATSNNETQVIYLKVYADKENMDLGFYVDTIDNVIARLYDMVQDSIGDGELPPVFEPISMTETEFNNLPEFTGY